MTCDTAGCDDDREDWYVWLPTGIQWCCPDCADQYQELVTEASVQHRPDPDQTTL